MPEVLEIELYRRTMAPLVGRTIASVDAPDEWYLKGGLTADAVRGLLVGERLAGLRRRGKLLLVDLQPSGSVLGLRFGMTGRPLVDDQPPPFELEYSSRRTNPAWIRFSLGFEGGGRFAIEDPRRLGGVELDPVEAALGPDAFSLTRSDLEGAVVGRSAIKAVLLDQSRLAGLGNMLADEVLFRAGIDPARPAVALLPTDIERLHDAVGEVLPELLELGGSHQGQLSSALRHPGARCPLDGTELVRRTIGGRTTYSCPLHQA